MTSDEIEITREVPANQDLAALMGESTAEMATRYSTVGVHEFDAKAAEESGGLFLIARQKGVPMGCGALRPLGSGVCEFKRMYVRPKARRRGIARRLLVHLESSARDLGFGVIRLETGTRQPEVIALYERSDYRRIPPFGEYVSDPFSVCFEKRLE